MRAHTHMPGYNMGKIHHLPGVVAVVVLGIKWKTFTPFSLPERRRESHIRCFRGDLR